MTAVSPLTIPAGEPLASSADGATFDAPALTGMRAIAAFMVMALHVGIYTGQVASSWLGIGQGGPLGVVLARCTVAVPVFFVLSGFLLYRPYAAAGLAGRGRPATLRYLGHRALRILPPYWIAALAALLLFAPVHPWETLRALLLLHIYGQGGIPTGITQTWSLATEVAFYLVLPLIAVVLHPLLRRPAMAFAALGVLEVVTIVSVVATHVPSAGAYPQANFWLPEYLGYFAAGMALAVVSASGARFAALARYPWAGWVVALVGYVLLSSPITGSTSFYPTVGQALLEHVLNMVVAVALVAPLLAAPQRGPARPLSRGIPAWFGRISYGLFLWHMVVVESWFRLTETGPGTVSFAVLFPLTVAVTTVLAWLSYILIERPARRLRRAFPSTRRKTADGIAETTASLGR
ncbi:acyltransferase family protein [Nocardia sp. NPDC050175]|uniref:acyltransferase family protein n=1 Tax=Nocardia sp. NPDC050175 TaxID=3364317 RepID=UPI00378A4333